MNREWQITNRKGEIAQLEKRFFEKGEIVFQVEKINREKHLEKNIERLENIIEKKEVELSLVNCYKGFFML